MTSRRLIYVALLGLTIVLGLLSRSSLVAVGSPIRHYAGDTLWAMAVFWSLAILWPEMKSLPLGICTLAIALTIEISQLYHVEWLDCIRSLKPAALILGNTFLWSDLACYAVGTMAAALITFQFLQKES